jgi:hypothetical protein
MASLAKRVEIDRPDAAINVRVTDTQLFVDLLDGRSIGTPLAWYPSLRNASRAALENWRIDGAARGVHWPDLDEDLSVEGMLDGRPAVGWDR